MEQLHRLSTGEQQYLRQERPKCPTAHLQWQRIRLLVSPPSHPPRIRSEIIRHPATTDSVAMKNQSLTVAPVKPDARQGFAAATSESSDLRSPPRIMHYARKHASYQKLFSYVSIHQVLELEEHPYRPAGRQTAAHCSQPRRRSPSVSEDNGRPPLPHPGSNNPLSKKPSKKAEKKSKKNEIKFNLLVVIKNRKEMYMSELKDLQKMCLPSSHHLSGSRFAPLRLVGGPATGFSRHVVSLGLGVKLSRRVGLPRSRHRCVKKIPVASRRRYTPRLAPSPSTRPSDTITPTTLQFTVIASVLSA